MSISIGIFVGKLKLQTQRCVLKWISDLWLFLLSRAEAGRIYPLADLWGGSSCEMSIFLWVWGNSCQDQGRTGLVAAHELPTFEMPSDCYRGAHAFSHGGPPLENEENVEGPMCQVHFGTLSSPGHIRTEGSGVPAGVWFPCSPCFLHSEISREDTLKWKFMFVNENVNFPTNIVYKGIFC